MIPADWRNLVTMFFKQADRLGERPFLWVKREGQFRPMSWRDVAARVSAFTRGLQKAGIQPGDRVVIVSENRPGWLIADLAIMAAGGVTVPAYTTNTTENHRYILENSGAKGVVVSTPKLAERVLPAAQASPETSFLVMIEPGEVPPTTGVDILAWEDLMIQGEHGHTNVIQAAKRLKRSDLACIIYTSGTGGAPKGVMLHHGALLHNCAGAADALSEIGLDDVVFLSFLPLSHAYEHTAGQFFPIYIGAQIYYAESVDKLTTNLPEVRPTIMTAVPRLYETLHQRITHGVRAAGGIKEKMFTKALEIGTRRVQDPDSLGLLDRLMDSVLDRLVRDKVRARFGGRLKALVSGGAPLNPEIGTFFAALGLPVFQGYGQTEAAPLISVNRPKRVKMNTVGRPIKDVEVWIAADGEILVRGEMVMQGYWRNEEATREVLRDGWLHTGDIGEVDEHGYIRITDRKKDIIVNSGGDNLSPARIESMLTLRPEIAQAMVYGDHRPHLVGLIVPDEGWLKTWARDAGKPADLAALADDKDLRTALATAIEKVNATVPIIEKVRRFVIAPEPFTVENAQLTPTMKIRRHVLKQTYGGALDGLYPKE